MPTEILNDIWKEGKDGYKEGLKLMGTASPLKRHSLSRLTDDLIFQFPLAMSAGIDVDEYYPIAKLFEKNYANLVMTAIIAEGVVDRDLYPTISEFLKQFHHNDKIPIGIGEESDTDMDDDVTVAIEAIIEAEMLTRTDMKSLYNTIEDKLCMKNINHTYQPFRNTLVKMKNALENAYLAEYGYSIATEERMVYVIPNNTSAGSIIPADPRRDFTIRNPLHKDGSDEQKAYLEQNPEVMYMSYSDAMAFRKSGKMPRAKDESDDKNDKPIDLKDQDQDPSDMEGVPKDAALAKAKHAGKFELVKDNQFINISPTMLKLTIANKAQHAGVWYQDLSVGVKCMPRLFPQTLMVNTISEMCASHPVMQFIKLTRGELKTSEFIFGLKDARDEVNSKGTKKWLYMLKRRAAFARGQRLFKAIAFGNRGDFHPSTTILMTEEEALEVKRKTGFDVHNPKVVQKIMNKYFILGFGIYDTSGQMLSLMYDGERDFSQFSLRTMIVDAKKDAMVLNSK